MGSFSLALAILAAMVVLAQPSPPAQGIQLGDPATGYDIRFPFTVTQCEPVFIYYNITNSTSSVFLFFTIQTQELLSTRVLQGVGYFEWVCNIPAGYSFWVNTAIFLHYLLVVQPGSSSSCLSNITTTYQYVMYDTTAWTSYTANPPVSIFTDTYGSVATSTVAFPTGSFSTFILNPDLIVATPTLMSRTSPAPAIKSSSLSPSASSRKSRAPAIAGGVIGGLVVAVASCVIFIRLRKRRAPHLEIPDEPIVTSPARASALVVTPQYLSLPANYTISNWDPSMLPSNLASGDVPSSANQAGGLLLASTASSVAPTSNPQLTFQPHQSTYPQPASDPNAPQREASMHSSAGPSAPASHTRPVSGTEAESDADVVTTLTAFARLPPERMRALFPVLGDIMTTLGPSEAGSEG